MYCVDNCLLLPLVDILTLMDPNGSLLQVINPVRGDYNSQGLGHCVARSIPVQAPLGHLRLGSLPAYLLETLLALRRRTPVPVQVHDSSGDHARKESLGLNPTEYEEAEYGELILESIQERPRSPGLICLTLGKIVVYIHMKN